MSASTQKKNRIAAREAGTDKKLLAQQEEASKKQASKRRWTIGTIAVAVLIVLIILLNSNLLYTSTTAATVGEYKFSPAEVNYCLATQYSNFVQSNSDYVSLFFDTSKGVKGLADQECTLLGDGSSWRDYFMQMALNQLREISSLVDYANEQGITLTEDEQAAVRSQIDSFGIYANVYGFADADHFLSAQYGDGVTVKTVEKLMLDSALADKAAVAYTDSLSYSDEELESYYSENKDSMDRFDYAYYLVSAETVEVAGEDGTTTNETTEETKAAAKATAEAIVAAYAEAEGESMTERLTAAVRTQVAEGEAREVLDAAGSSLGTYADYLTDAARQPGDVSTVEGTNGCFVVLFMGRNDNHYRTVSARHILVKAVAEADGSYTDEAKAEALAKIESIKAEFDAGDKSEESFIALVESYSEDAGSVANGGLYEEIYKGQMVSEFNDFCFGGHKAGDMAIVYGENGGYAGYHLVYFVGENDLYSSVLARDALISTAAGEWQEARLENYPAATAFWSKLVA